MTHWRAPRKPVDAEGRYRAAYGPAGRRDTHQRPSGGPRWALVWFWISFVALLALLSNAAFGTSGYWRCGNGPHVNVNGMDCCDVTDCAIVPNEIAWPAKVGSQVEVVLNGMVRTMIVNTVFPSCDPNGKSWGCPIAGCLFRSTGL